MSRPATAGEILRILEERSRELEAMIGIAPAQLSLPVDGHGSRVRVSVLPGMGSKVPRSVEFTLDGIQLLIPLDTVEDYEDPIEHIP